MAGIDNDVFYGLNADFTGSNTVLESSGLFTNGQLWIGSTAVNAGNTHINVGTITSPLGTINIGYSSPNITMDITGGALAVEHLTGNTGGQLNPTSNNFNIITANSTPVFAGSGSTLTLDFGLTNLILGSNATAITSATNNTALGNGALLVVSSGGSNTCIGTSAGALITTGSDNTLIGRQAGLRVTGGQNVLIGMQCATNMTGSSSNIIIGRAAGSGYVASANNNIIIGDSLAGVAGEDNVIRIGSTATTCFIKGIDGVNVGSVAKVVTMASDQLGTASITGSGGITITPGANTIDVSITSGAVVTSITGGPGITITGTAAVPIVNSVIFTDTTATTLTVDSGFFATAAGTYNMPATAAQGEVIEIVCDTSGAVVLDCPALNFIRIGNLITSSGGTVTSTLQGDALKIRYRASTLTWEAVSVIGTWIVA